MDMRGWREGVRKFGRLSLLPVTQEVQGSYSDIPGGPSYLTDGFLSVLPNSGHDWDLSSPPTPHHTPQAPLLFPASTHVPLSRLVLAATGNCDSGVWLARGLPPPTSGRPGRSQPWRTPRALPPDVHQGPGQGCPPLGRAETPRGFLLGAAVGVRAAAPTAYSGYPHVPGEKTEVQRGCYICSGHTAELVPWGCSAGSGRAQLASRVKALPV